MKRAHDVLLSAPDCVQPLGEGEPVHKQPRHHEEEVGDTEETLSKSQQEALDAILRGHNVLVTGKAGSGKSFLLERVRQELEARQIHLQMTATTGSAAWNIGGTTLHSWAGIGLGERTNAEKFAKELLAPWRRDKLKDWQWTECLIIDEISMVKVEFFEKLETIARRLKNATKPFGGIQLVLVGDYFQCPPIVKGNEKRQYLFESPLWQRLHIQCIGLKQNFRQAEDAGFRGLLDRMQIGELGPEDLETMRGRIQSQQQQQQNCTRMTRLCARRATAEAINHSEIEKLAGQSHCYTGLTVQYDDNGIPRVPTDPKDEKKSESRYPVDELLRLKVGALVLLCCNLDVAQGLYNGTRGTVVDFRRPDNAAKSVAYPFVEFDGGQRVLVQPHQWDSFKKKRLVSTFMQVPLMPRYAMTIHKSQGLTLDQALVTMDFFDTGLAYVAFSRVRRLEDLFLTNVDEKKVLVDPVVVDFARRNGLLD